MFSQEMLEEIAQWKRRTMRSQDQLDRRWLQRYRELASYDGHWWLAHAGPFTLEEQEQWDQLSGRELDDAIREQLSHLLIQSRERELALAIAEQREPQLHYPAIDIMDVRRRIADLTQLDTEIEQEESNDIVRYLYHGTIEEELDYLRLIEASYEGNNEKFWMYNRRSDPEPTSKEMATALAYFKRELLRGLRHPRAKEAGQRVIQLMHDQFKLSLDLSDESVENQEQLLPDGSSPTEEPMVEARTAQHFFEAVMQESGYNDWCVIIDPSATNARIEQGLRYIFLPDKKMSVEKVKHLLAHELAGHVARCVTGTYSPIGLLGIHAQHSLPTDEGLAIYYERRAASIHGEPFDDWIIWIGGFSVGLASGVITPPQTFLSLYTFFEAFYFYYRLLEEWDNTVQEAHERARRSALTRCLRTFRGVPDLKQAGICYTKDVVYLRGVLQIEHAVVEDETILDRLAVGVITPEHLPMLQGLDLIPPPQPLRQLAYNPNLDSFILSFEQTKVDEESG